MGSLISCFVAKSLGKEEEKVSVLRNSLHYNSIVQNTCVSFSKFVFSDCGRVIVFFFLAALIL